MPAVIVLVVLIILVAVAIPVVHAIVAVIAAHLMLIGIALAVGVPAAIVVLVALMRGAHRHTVIAWHEPRTLPPPPTRLELPAPARPMLRPAEGALGGYWPDEEAGDPGASAPEADPVTEDCDGPRCASPCGPSPWTIDVEVPGKDGASLGETRRFCSKECAEEYTWLAPEAEVILS